MPCASAKLNHFTGSRLPRGVAPVWARPIRKPAQVAERNKITGEGAIAQLVERLVRNEKVSGSNPLSSTIRIFFPLLPAPLLSRSPVALPMRRLRSLSLPALGLCLVLTQTGCGVLAHNVGRLMRIPSSVLSLEESATPPAMDGIEAINTIEEAAPSRDASAPAA